MHSSRPLDAVRKMDFPLQMQGVHSLLATNLPNPKTVRGKTVTLVMGVDGLANNAFVNYMMGSHAPAQAAAYARVTSLPSQENTVLCECPALGAKGLSEAANIAASFSTEITLGRAKDIQGVVVVIPFEYLSTIKGDEQFSYLMSELSNFVGFDASVAKNAIQIVVLGNDLEVTTELARNAYARSLGQFIAEGKEIQLVLTLAEQHNEPSKKVNSLMSVFLESLKSSDHPVLFVNRAVVSSGHNGVNMNDVFGASSESIARQINSLEFCNPAVFQFQKSHPERSIFDEALEGAIAHYASIFSALQQKGERSKCNKTLMRAMASFLSLPHITSFKGKENFLSEWQFQNSVLSSNRQGYYYRLESPSTSSIDSEATAKCRV